MTLRSPQKLKLSKIYNQPPTLTLIVPPKREYAMTLQQTKLVYDQLLADKHSKLHQVLSDRKAEYDKKCSELNTSDKDTALEFGVRAQQALNQLCDECSEQLIVQRRDYQDKLNKMYNQLEEKWTQDRKPPLVQYTVYPQK